MIWLQLPPKLAHDISSWVLPWYGRIISLSPPKWQSVHWRHLHFPNPVGIAGGVDKEGSCVQSWWNFGAGFVEIGTVTPLPQTPNPGSIMLRDVKRQALWNKMGFPSSGADAVVKRLAKIPSPRKTPIFINIGKNRQTSLENAFADYETLSKKLSPYADGLVINISSPNTPDLRKLQAPDKIAKIIEKVRSGSVKAEIPVLLKLSPDLNEKDLSETIHAALDAHIDGFIFTNTTLARTSDMNFPVEGGVSGSPLASASKKTLAKAIDIMGAKRNGKLIISCGGIMNAQDVQDRLNMGADLIQVYSTLIFNGPFWPRNIAKQHIDKKHTINQTTQDHKQELAK